jgi:hypothetical protein
MKQQEVCLVGKRVISEMPKLDGTQIAERLQGRLEELRRGEDVAARDLRALLTTEQQAAMDAAWAEQQALRKSKRARTKEEEAAMGWKTKRDIHIAALKSAFREAQDAEVAAWKKRQHDAEVRQGRVYFDELKKETDAGADLKTAKIRANNALTRAKLKRLDGEFNGTQGLTQRDREIRAIEDVLFEKFKDTMSDIDYEQMQMVIDHEKALAEMRRKHDS